MAARTGPSRSSSFARQAPVVADRREIVAKLFPDRAKLQKEEQRRFELLVAHWDVPLNRIDLGTRKPTR